MTSDRFTLVSFHAHPDDESFLTGGTLAKAAADGHRVVLVTATDGGRGLASRADGSGSVLGALRSRELEQAANALGCARLVRLGYRDSGLEANAAEPDAFANADPDEVAVMVAAILVEEHADVLTVYDARGGYGHPDHVQVHRAGTKAAALAGTPVVLEATLDGDLVGRALRLLSLIRSPLRHAAPLGGRDLYTPRRLITHRVDITGQPLAAKRRAMSAHASQQRADGQVRMLTRFLRLPNRVFALLCGREWFVEQGRAGGPIGGDIFSSLRHGPVRTTATPVPEVDPTLDRRPPRALRHRH